MENQPSAASYYQIKRVEQAEPPQRSTTAQLPQQQPPALARPIPTRPHPTYQMNGMHMQTPYIAQNQSMPASSTINPHLQPHASPAPYTRFRHYPQRAPVFTPNHLAAFYRGAPGPLVPSNQFYACHMPIPLANNPHLPNPSLPNVTLQLLLLQALNNGQPLQIPGVPFHSSPFVRPQPPVPPLPTVAEEIIDVETVQEEAPPILKEVNELSNFDTFPTPELSSSNSLPEPEAVDVGVDEGQEPSTSCGSEKDTSLDALHNEPTQISSPILNEEASEPSTSNSETNELVTPIEEDNQTKNERYQAPTAEERRQRKEMRKLQREVEEKYLSANPITNPVLMNEEATDNMTVRQYFDIHLNNREEQEDRKKVAKLCQNLAEMRKEHRKKEPTKKQEPRRKKADFSAVGPSQQGTSSDDIQIKEEEIEEPPQAEEYIPGTSEAPVLKEKTPEKVAEEVEESTEKAEELPKEAEKSPVEGGKEEATPVEKEEAQPEKAGPSRQVQETEFYDNPVEVVMEDCHVENVPLEKKQRREDRGQIKEEKTDDEETDDESDESEDEEYKEEEEIRLPVRMVDEPCGVPKRWCIVHHNPPTNIKDVEWVECSQCKKWFHTICVRLNNKKYTKNERFRCCRSITRDAKKAMDGVTHEKWMSIYQTNRKVKGARGKKPWSLKRK